ncbi:MAG: DUF4956 domain-containing protein [Oscillospiraceae bacterium]|nr:DUF4956 domain-containing protein [Oscillospiraceae bacterium]
MINFADIVKGKFLEEFSAISMSDALVAIALSFALSLFIVFIYRVTYAGVNYSRNFTGCMMMLSMVTTLVILVISSNMVLSLGMVGALSIVRFRTAVKEPTDTAFLFWAIATGIICGAGYVTIAILATLLMGLLFVLVHAMSGKQKYGSYMIVVRCDSDSPIESKLSGISGYRLKNKTMTSGYTELVAEVKLTDAAVQHMDSLREIPGVKEISVMSSVGGSVL